METYSAYLNHIHKLESVLNQSKQMIEHTSHAAQMVEKQQQALKNAFRTAEIFNSSDFRRTVTLFQNLDVFDNVKSYQSAIASSAQAVNSAKTILADLSSIQQAVSNASNISAASSDLIPTTLKLTRSFSSIHDAKRAFIQAFTIPPVFSVSSFAHDIKTAMIDEETGEFTDAFYILEKDISTLPPEDLNIVQNDSSKPSFSQNLLTIISKALPKSTEDHLSQFKSLETRLAILGIILELTFFAINMCTSFIDSAERSAFYRESLAIQRETLEQEQLQTKYLKELASSSHNSKENIDPANDKQNKRDPQ